MGLHSSSDLLRILLKDGGGFRHQLLLLCMRGISRDLEIELRFSDHSSGVKEANGQLAG